MTKRLRIGIDTLFEDPLKPSGATGYLKTLLRWLPRVGPKHEYVAFVSRRNRHLWEANGDLRFVWSGASNDRLLLRILSQQALEPWRALVERLDVFNAPGNVGPLLVPTPLVLTIKTLHHYHTPEALGPARTLYRRLMVDASAARARLIVANCEATKREIVSLVKVPEERVRVVYEAVHEVFSPAKDESGARARVREQFGITEPFLLFVSSLWRYKNPDGVIRGFAALPEADRQKVILVVVGQDYEGYLSDLRSLAAQLGVGDRVRFIGALPNVELPDLYRAAEMLVYASHQETFGMPVVEAMRCGTPIVASTVPALQEVAGDAAVFVESRDYRGIAAAVSRLLHSRVEREALRDRGLRRGQLFSGERMAKETLAVYEEAAS
jgi:glycosyltransferase involved in cell wall biosynthesis